MKRLAPFLVCIVTLVLAEATVRAFFATRVGPRVLFYGTSRFRNFQIPVAQQSAQSHGNQVGDYQPYEAYGSRSYSKYFPNESKVTESPDHRETYPVRINNHGFRGKDFAIEKAPGTVRVVTLGASSTFGYHDRDEETYPYYLEQILNGQAPDGTRFEVINFGIPHAISDNMVALFLAEGVPLDPDVVTFYEGANDSAVLERGDPGLRGTVWMSLRRRLLGVELLNYVLGLGASADGYGWSDELAERRSQAFLRNIRLLSEECRKRGIRLIVTTQQMQPVMVGSQAKGTTYQDDVRLVKEKLARGEVSHIHFDSPFLNPVGHLLSQFDPARVLLIHARMMSDLAAWAATSDVGFVDLIAALDHDRDLLVNWVHLKAEGNRKIAEALAPEVLRQVAIRRQRPRAAKAAVAPGVRAAS